VLLRLIGDTIESEQHLYTVLAEDGVALVGVLMAAAGIFFSHLYDMPVLDGVASLSIGMLLGGVALLLVREARGLLIGEGMRPESIAAIQRMVEEEERVVAHVRRVRSLYVAPDEVIVSLRLRFTDDTSANDATRALMALKQRIRARYPMVAHLLLEVGHLDEAQADERTSGASGTRAR
ncbi:MAG: hypothetical protein QM749_08180, partial [Aquabacterium sp.]